MIIPELHNVNLCKEGSLTIHIDRTHDLSFCWVPPGSFLMGSANSEHGHEDSESPQHRVVISRGFRMSCTTITNNLWSALMGVSSIAEPSRGEHPVTDVNWHDVQRFIERLSGEHTQFSFRLPTEAEWEYACRAGTTARYSSGENEDDLGHSGWYAGNSNGMTHPVRNRAPNAWGFYDMHGNVFELCQDWDGPYSAGEQKNPTGPASGEKRILRGGCFKCPPSYCRSANRYSAPPERRAPNFGFRVVLGAERAG